MTPTERDRLNLLIDHGDRIRLALCSPDGGSFQDRLEAGNFMRVSWPLLSAALREAKPSQPDTEPLGCGCVITRGWRCPVHNAP